MGVESWISKGGADRFAKRLAQVQGLAEGGARRASLQNGTNYSPGRGYTTVPVVQRTQVQAAVWGNTGQIGSTKYSGYGQLNLDRGFRSVHHVLGQDKMRSDDVDEVPFINQRQRATGVSHRPQRPGSISGGIGGVRTQRGESSEPSPWAMGPVIETTATEGKAWEMPPAKGSKPYQGRLPF